MAVCVYVFVSNDEALPVCYVMGQMGDNDKSQSTDPNKHIHTKLKVFLSLLSV